MLTKSITYIKLSVLKFILKLQDNLTYPQKNFRLRHAASGGWGSASDTSSPVRRLTPAGTPKFKPAELFFLRKISQRWNCDLSMKEVD